MIHSKNLNQGFSFIEIVLAVAIIGLVLTALFNLQSNLFNISFNQHSKILRLFNIKNVFFDHETENKLLNNENLKETFQGPEMLLTVTMQKPDKKSSLAKFENIYLIKSTGKWRALAKNNEETLVSLWFHVKKEKKEK